MSMKKSIGKAREKCANVPVLGGIINPKPKVAVIRLSGVIADVPVRRRQTISYAKYADLIDQAFDVYKLQSVALIINSPGGSAAQSALVAGHIRRLAEEKEVPVNAFVEDAAASGGYWLACAADKIYAQDVSIVGSIGVISASFGFQELINRYGVERRVYTAGEEKSFLDPFQQEKPEDVKRLKSIQGELHESFIDWVKERRGESLKGKDKDLFEGQFWTGKTALDKGVIDGIGNVYDVCKREYGEDVKFVEFSPDSGFLASLFGADASLPREALASLEERASWSRFGV